MKSIIFLRHGKAAQPLVGQRDFERPLVEKGIDEVQNIAERLIKRNLNIDMIFSSPARRTQQTAQIVSEKIKSATIEYNSDIYESSINTMIQLIHKLPINKDHILIVGHNPCLTEIMSKISNSYIDNLPTSGIYQLSFETKTWDNIGEVKGKLDWIDYPKLN